MEQYIDLHMHSIYSEGVKNCQELLEQARQHGLAVISLTDHDVIDGVPEIVALSKKYNIKVITGVELYTRHAGRGLHLLGYNFSIGETILAGALRKIQTEHLVHVKHTIAKLEKQGFRLDAGRIFADPSRYLGVVHLIRSLEQIPANRKKIKKDLGPASQDYFTKVVRYFGESQPAYLPQIELPTMEAIDMINKSGGVAVLAHPGQQLAFEGDHLILDLVKKGLRGLEVLSPYHDWHQIEHYQRLALAHNLLITGGSDYHTDLDYSKRELIKRQWDYFKVPYAVYERLKSQINIQQNHERNSLKPTKRRLASTSRHAGRSRS